MHNAGLQKWSQQLQAALPQPPNQDSGAKDDKSAQPSASAKPVAPADKDAAKPASQPVALKPKEQKPAA